MSFYERHAAERDHFEILAFHDAAAASLEELDEKLKPIVAGTWKGKPLPFPILLDATDQTHRTNFGIQSYPTVILIDPEGKLVRQSGEHDLESILTAAQRSGVSYAVAPNGATASTRGDLVEVSRRHQALLSLQAGGSEVTAVALSQRFVAAASRDRSIRIWDTRNGRERTTLRGHSGAIFALAFSPDGKRLASAGFDTARLWDVATGRENEALAGQRFPSWSVAFSPDGRTLAAGGFHAVRLWRTFDGTETGQLKAGSIGHALAFAPDGSALAVGDGPNITFWKLATRTSIRSWTAHASDVVWLQFDPEARALASVSRGGMSEVWSTLLGRKSAAPPPALVRAASAVAAHLTEVPGALLEESKAAVGRPGLSRDEYLCALLQASAAAEAAAFQTNALEALGAAYFRLGQFVEAERWLTRCDELRQATSGSGPSTHLTYRSLARLRTGNVSGARSDLVRIWEVYRGPEVVNAVVRRELFAEFFGTDHEAGRKLASSALERSGSYTNALATLTTAPPDGTRESAVRILPVLVAGRSVRAWQEEFALKDHVLQRVQEDTTQAAVVREWMQEFAVQMREDPDQLNEASWAVASQPGRPPAAYALALAQAEKACRLETNHARLNTLGVAQFRAGQFEKALSTLLKAQSQNPRGQESPSDVAFIALTQFQLGQVEAARKNLAQLRERVKEESDNEEAAALLREAESVIAGPEK